MLNNCGNGCKLKVALFRTFDSYSFLMNIKCFEVDELINLS